MQHKWQALRFMKHKGTKKPAEAGFYFWMINTYGRSFPQNRHNIASFFIVSAQYGHFLVSPTEPAPADSTPITCGSSFTTPGFVKDQTSAAIQPKKLQPKTIFSTQIAVAFLCSLELAITPGRT